VTAVFSTDVQGVSSVRANSANSPGTGSASVTVDGLGFGLGDYTVAAMAGSTACEASDWISTTTVACRSGAALGGQAVRSALTNAVEGLLGVAPLDGDLVETAAEGLNSVTSIATAGSATERNQTLGLTKALIAGAKGAGGTSSASAASLAGLVASGVTESIGAGANSSSVEEVNEAEQLNALGDAVLEGHVPGQNPTVLAGTVPMTFAKLSDDPAATNGLNVTLTQGGFFSLPQAGILSQVGTTDLKLRMFEFDNATDTHGLEALNSTLRRTGVSVSFEFAGISLLTAEPIRFEMSLLSPPGSEAFNDTADALNGTNASAPVVERCTYWDPLLKIWSAKGCAVVGVSATSIQCECFHLTEFASSSASAMPNVNTVDPIGGASRPSPT